MSLSFLNNRVLGINSRNFDYIFQYNSRKYYKSVDEKLQTKLYAKEVSIPVPETYAVIELWSEISSITEDLKKYDSFVIKPNRGAAGRGVFVVKEKLEDSWILADGKSVSSEDVHYHISSILSGLYSLSELPDKAIVEQRIIPHPFFNEITWEGTPDIRIILFQAVPVMAMLRLPTKKSGGRANLHQGAVGVGVDIDSGKTNSAVIKNYHVEVHPDTNAKLIGLKIPSWKKIFEDARKLARVIPLKYIGIDFMLDFEHGHLVVEANARPGLNIQLANNLGLRTKLEAIRNQRME